MKAPDRCRWRPHRESRAASPHCVQRLRVSCPKTWLIDGCFLSEANEVKLCQIDANLEDRRRRDGSHDVRASEARRSVHDDIVSVGHRVLLMMD